MKRIVVTLYRKREKMKKKSLKAVGTVLAVCLCATACGGTASTTIEDNTVKQRKHQQNRHLWYNRRKQQRFHRMQKRHP